MEINEIKNYMKRNKITYAELAEMTGLSISTVTKIFGGFAKYPRVDTMKAIEKALGLDKPQTAEIIPFKNRPRPNADLVELNDFYPIPLLGEVVAGVPIEAQENLEGYIYIAYRPAEEYFALRVHGDSMKNAGLADRSVIVCHKQETAENGEIVVAMLNGEQTVKRYKIHGGNIFLMPENPDYLPIPITPSDDFIILGKVVEIRIMV